MYTKILLVIIIFILSIFFYLHTQNPEVVTFVVTRDHTYVVPVTLVLFAGFFAGAVMAVMNSLLVDARRAFKDMKARKEERLVAIAEENYHKGIEELVKGNTTQARELIEKAVKAKPGDIGMVISLSETYIRENKPREALKILENRSIINPNSIGILIAIARCSADSGDTYKAAKAYEEVLRLDPKNPYALRKLRDYKVRECSWNDAAILQKTLLECDHDENSRRKERRFLSGLLYEAAHKYCEDGRLSDSVIKVKEIMKNDENFLPAHVLLGEILWKQDNVQNAVKVWEKARFRFPNSEPLFLRLEELYIKESSPEKILEKYKKEIIARPTDINLRLLLSRLYLKLEMVDNAIEELERVHQEDDSFYAQVLLGEAYLRRKQTGKAAHLLQKALGLDKEFLPPFVCTHCSHVAKPWSPRCPSCGEWNTLVMNGSPNAPKHTPVNLRRIK